MTDWRWTWWMLAATAIGLAELVLGIGNIVSLVQDDRRSVASALVAFVVATAAAALVFGGLAIRRQNRPRGSAVIAVGMFPGCAAVVMWWFLPALVIGVLCMVATMSAVMDALNSRTALKPAA